MVGVVDPHVDRNCHDVRVCASREALLVQCGTHHHSTSPLRSGAGVGYSHRESNSHADAMGRGRGRHGRDRPDGSGAEVMMPPVVE